MNTDIDNVSILAPSQEGSQEREQIEVMIKDFNVYDLKSLYCKASLHCSSH